MTVRGPYEFPKTWMGTSSDTKPTEWVKPGDEFFETNTRLWYIYDGANWGQKVTAASGSDVMTTATDPAIDAAVSTVIVDAYRGVIVTLTAAGNVQTLQDPTIVTAGKRFTVINNDTSSDTIAVNGITLAAGDAQTFVWDGTVWSAIASTYATTSSDGVVELATDAETVTGTDALRATTSANLTAKMSAPGTIGDETPAEATFKPGYFQDPVAITSFAGTASRATNVVTFTEEEDAVKAGYDATNPKLGFTIVLSGNTMITTSWTSSTQVIVGSSGTIAGATPTSVQAPYWSSADNSSPRVLKSAKLASGNLYESGNVGIGTTSPGAKLEVSGSSGTAQMFVASTNSGSAELRLSNTLANWANYVDSNNKYYIRDRAAGLDRVTINSDGNVGIGTTSPIFKADINGSLYSRLRHGRFMFDDAPVGTQLSAVPSTGLLALNGTNYAAANATVQANGAQLITAAADDDSIYAQIMLPLLNTTSNPRFSFRFKVDTVANSYVAVGLVDAVFADKGTLPNNCALVGIDADNGHTFGAARLILTTNDDAAGADYDDLGSNMSDNTWVWGVVDLTDTEQPRVWIAGAEIAAGSITGTVKDATAFYLYVMLQNLAGGAKTLTVKCDHWSQDQA